MLHWCMVLAHCKFFLWEYGKWVLSGGCCNVRSLASFVAWSIAAASVGQSVGVVVSDSYWDSMCSL